MFTFPFCYTPHPLVEMAAGCLRSYLDKRADLADELQSGKMMGVLVVENSAGEVGYLAAFSGNLSHSNDHDFFVPAVYDILCPDGEFKRREAEITEINRRVDQAERCEAMAEARSAVDEVRMRGEKAVADYRAYMAQCKAERQRLRANGGDTAALVAESQYQKAELKRLRRRVDGEVRLAGSRLSALEAEVATLKEERRRLSESLQRWIFDRFVMLDAKGDRRDDTSLFITEGLSATGTITKVRNVETQAVFSLRGKPLNTFGKSQKDIKANEEFYLLDAALDIADGIENLRYNKVIIATDADVDGMHIRLLMITYFLQFYPDLVKKGHVYILQTPLFRVRNKNTSRGKKKVKDETYYCYTDDERVTAINRLGKNAEITRFKGLGEISADEFKDFIGPDMRLDQVKLRKEDSVKEMLEFYMGKNTMERQLFIVDNLVVEDNDNMDMTH